MQVLRVLSGVSGGFLGTFGVLTSIHGLFNAPHHVLVPGIISLLFGGKLLSAAVTGDADPLDNERKKEEERRLREAGVNVERELPEKERIRNLQESLKNTTRIHS